MQILEADVNEERSRFQGPADSGAGEKRRHP
jgi:hypothetical protein